MFPVQSTYQVDLEGVIARAPQEVIQTKPKPLKGHADMASVLKPLLKAYAMELPRHVILLQCVQHLELQAKASLFTEYMGGPCHL